MSILNRPVTRSVYVVVLSKDDPSPLAPESDDEKAQRRRKADKEKEKDKRRTRRAAEGDGRPVDVEDLRPADAGPAGPGRRTTSACVAGKAGSIFLARGPGGGRLATTAMGRRPGPSTGST